MENYGPDEICVKCGMIYDKHHPDTDRCAFAPPPLDDGYFEPTHKISDEEFVAMIQKMLCIKTSTALATELLLSIPTIERWSVGKNLAHWSLRRGLKRYLDKSLAEYLKRSQE